MGCHAGLYRQVVAVIALLVAMLGVSPGIAQAHGMVHGGAAMVDPHELCEFCVEVSTERDVMTADTCPPEACCAATVYALPGASIVGRCDHYVSQSIRPTAMRELRSIDPGSDLPPPKV